MRQVLAAIAAVVLTVIGVSIASAAGKSADPAGVSGAVLFRTTSTAPAIELDILDRDGRIAVGRLSINAATSRSVERNGWALTRVGDTTWTNYTYHFL